MMAHHILDFDLEISQERFLEEFWFSSVFYEQFLRESLQDEEVIVGEWREREPPASSAEPASLERIRHVQSKHPCKVSFPGLPSHADSVKVQKISFENQDELSILESNTFKGIPMADYFRVDTLWCVRRIKGGSAVNIIITGEVVFLHYTWLKGSIESNTYSELDDVFASWKDEAARHVQSLSITNEGITDDHRMDDRAAIVSMPPLFSRTNSISTVLSDNDVDEFYDCEEGGDVEYHHLQALHTTSSSFEPESPLIKYRDLLHRKRTGDHLLTPQELMDMYDQVESGGELPRDYRSSSGSEEGVWLHPGSEEDTDEKSGLLSPDGPESQSHEPMRRYIAITIVEILFVLAESSFWQVKRMYKHDVRELFRVEPVEVFQRVGCSFVPGKHTPLLASPDLYGPTVAACILPQVLLVAMDSTHHGCSRSSLLGDAVVVTLCLWFGLSGLYRVFGIIVAPMLTTKHCLCLTGYSLYPWIWALFLSYVFDTYPNNVVSPQLPLYLLGIPSAIAQGYVFWEYTPLSFRRTHLEYLPLSLRDLSHRHRRVTDSLLWYIPKAIVLVVIAVTHYQFLWYVAHTFLPGRKHLCSISAMINPSNYADILTQKELRSFASEVVKKVG